MKTMLDAHTLKPIEETSYLTAQNVERYRAIMRFMYIQHQRMKYWLRKEEIFEFLGRHEIFAGYTLEECQNDLKVLTDKKNLIAVQDTSKTLSIEEFKNKRFKFKLSDFSIELERLLDRLENSSGVKGSLESGLFEKLLEHIKKIEVIRNKPQSKIMEWWQDINRVFEDINKEYTDFISTLQSARVETLMSTEGFLIYKDKLMSYLNQFINQLFQYQPMIEQQINITSKEQIEQILNMVVEREYSDPKNFIVGDKQVIEEDIANKWKNICSWFIEIEGYCEAKALIDATTEIIRKMTSYAMRIIENRSIAHNRREEYKHLARLFSALDLDECAKLSAVAFGVFNTRHIKGDFPRESESIYSSVADTASYEILLKSRSRGNRERMKPSPIKDDSAIKKNAFDDYRRKKLKEQELLSSIFRNGKICFDSLPYISSEVRKQLLLWLQRGIDGRLSRTDSGQLYRVILPAPGRRCTVEAEDGILEMPAFEIVFLEGEN